MPRPYHHRGGGGSRRHLAPDACWNCGAAQHPQWVNPEVEQQRRALLTAALDMSGLEFRDDSKLCNNYVRFGAGTVDDIVDKLGEMKWFIEQTAYQTHRRNQTAENAKHLAFGEFMDMYLGEDGAWTCEESMWPPQVIMERYGPEDYRFTPTPEQLA